MNWTRGHSVAVVVLGLAMPVSCWILVAERAPFTAWAVSLVLAMGVLLVIGSGIVGYGFGALIDDRNVLSLSRLQMTLWTVLILTSIMVIGISNSVWSAKDALDFQVPAEIWILMGISTISFVGAPLALSTQTSKEPDVQQMNREFDLLKKQGDSLQDLDYNGVVLVNTKPKMARLSDLITGDETGNAAHVDLAKLQMLVLTLVVWLGYAISIGKLIAHVIDDQGINEMPALDRNILTLVGISHAGYITSKGITKSKTE